jgi:riboflavin kinase/FMN adenylyltransferase
MHQSIVAKSVIAGRVIHGDKVGRTIGFPTANLDVVLTPEEVNPGAYVATAVVKGESGEPDQAYKGLAYFGPRYVLGEQTNSFEIYLYDFEGDLYGKVIEVTLGKFLHAPIAFTGLEELRVQLEKDKEAGMNQNSAM